jgi:hypothetical protein
LPAGAVKLSSASVPTTICWLPKPWLDGAAGLPAASETFAVIVYVPFPSAAACTGVTFTDQVPPAAVTV